MGETETDEAKVEAQKAAYLSFMEYVHATCTDNPPYAQGASLAVEAHRIQQDLKHVEHGSEAYTTWIVELSAINAQYYALRHDPRTIQGWTEATAKCREVDLYLIHISEPTRPY